MSCGRGNPEETSGGKFGFCAGEKVLVEKTSGVLIKLAPWQSMVSNANGQCGFCSAMQQGGGQTNVARTDAI